MSRGGHGIVLSRKAAEIGFSLVLLGFGAAIIKGALELDTGWGSSGPESGYFPLRIGLLIVFAAFTVLVLEVIRSGHRGVVISRSAAVNMALFGLPLLAFAAAVPFMGLYLAAVAYLLVAVGLSGRAGWRVAVSVAAIAPGVLFILFEFVFRTPLPKGPLGPLLGLI